MRENRIKVLSDLEHTRAKPAMYLGATVADSVARWVYDPISDRILCKEVQIVPGLLKLFDEIVSNSIDEYIRTEGKYANKIAVFVDETSVRVRDNGRGIPVVVSEGQEKTDAELAFTQLRAGSNFTEESQVSIGTHGLGASLVNIMSRKFVAKTADGKNELTVRCAYADGDLNTKTAVKASSAQYTEVQYYPEFVLFGVSEFDEAHQNMMYKRVLDLAVCYPDIQFKFNGKTVKSRRFKDYVAMIGEEGTAFQTLETDKFKLAVLASEEPKSISFVNGIDTYEGGTHVDFTTSKVCNEIRDLMCRKRNFKRIAKDMRPSEIRNRLNFVLITNDIPSPKFRSQTKEYITNPQKDFSEVLSEVADGKFINAIINNPDIMDPIVESRKLKLEAAERVALKKANRKLQKVKAPNHIPANGDPSQTVLFITEGLSASAMMTKVRDPEIHGCFPLRGKPMNTWNAKANRVVANKELQQLMGVIGLQLGQKATDLNYSKIKILCDADFDGSAIISLLLAFFFNWPELYEENRISIVRCPIVVAEKKGQPTKAFYTVRDYNQAQAQKELEGYSLAYLKGLGSLTPDQYETMIRQPVEDVISKDENSKEAFELAFGSDSDLRKQWLM